MHRRRRIRKSLMPSGAEPMDVDTPRPNGSGTESKPLGPSKLARDPTNIQTLTNKLESMTVKALINKQKQKAKPKYISTANLLTFTRIRKPD